MSTSSILLVSIVTPVHNGAQYLHECVESVLSQTYTHWEYLIVNNCSSDETLNIARRYAALDTRIHVHDYDSFVDVIESHNRALRLISPHSKYCKLLSADDCLLPDCIAQMVDLAETHPNVGIVGAYTIRGGGMHWRIVFDGLSYRTTVVPGREACRSHLLGKSSFLGVPTSILYRADLVRRSRQFYPNSRPHADVSAFYVCLLTTDLGFIHQVLTYERVHEDRLSTEANRFYTYAGSHLLDVQEYGPLYLTTEEMTERLDEFKRRYYRLLAASIVNFKAKGFWQYHLTILKACGVRWSHLHLAAAVLMKLCDLLFNPKLTIEKLVTRFSREVRP